MADATGTIYWYDPDPRAIIPLDTFHVPRRLQRTVKQQKFEVRFNSAFRAVMLACADRSRPGGWIDDSIINAYCRLNALGFAHSVECWQDGALVGGLYGVALRGLFAGESMFSHQRDASKVALVHLVAHLKQQGFVLLDTQFQTEHLAQFGTVEISAEAYRTRLEAALTHHPTF